MPLPAPQLRQGPTSLGTTILLESRGGGDGATPPLRAQHGPSPGLDLGPQVRMPRPLYFLVAAEQLRWGVLYASPRRAKPA